MAKVHRAYRHVWNKNSWWHPARAITRQDFRDMYILSEHLGLDEEVIAEHFGCSVERVQKAVALRGQEEEKQQAILRITMGDVKKVLREIDVLREVGEIRRSLAEPRRDQEEVLGIPAGVDALDWYRAWEKLKKGEKPPEKQTSQTAEEKREYYRDLVIDLYRRAGYSIGESCDKAYSSQGDDLIRYLADDKRHRLNRDHESEEPEAQPYQNALQ